MQLNSRQGLLVPEGKFSRICHIGFLNPPPQNKKNNAEIIIRACLRLIKSKETHEPKIHFCSINLKVRKTNSQCFKWLKKMLYLTFEYFH